MFTVSKALVRSIKTTYKSMFCSRHFSCTWLTEKIMFTVLRYGRQCTLCFWLIPFGDVLDQSVEEDPSQTRSQDFSWKGGGGGCAYLKNRVGACSPTKFSNVKALKRNFQHSQADSCVKKVPEIDRYFLLNFDKKNVVISCNIFS